MAGQVTVGIDIGTTSVKAAAADGDGRIVASARIPHAVRAPTPDVFEHDARVAWRDGTLAAWEAIRGELADRIEVAGVTVAAMVPSLCAVDGEGVPISAGLLYGDGRGMATGGSPAESGELAGFLAWLVEAHPEAAGYWPAQAAANAALCGVGAIDTATAMTAMPLFTGTGWSDEACAAVGTDPGKLPALSPGAEAIGSTAEGAVVSGGTIDALGEQLVAGADAPGDVLVICGTTLIVWAVTEEWVEADGLWTVPHTAPGLALVGGASNAGGLFLDWARRLVGASSDGGEADPGRVPVWVPYLRGERTPHHDPTRRARLVDLDVGHGPAAVMAAAHEASGFVVRHHLDLAAEGEPAVVTPERIVASGGGTQSARWMQGLADTTGLPVDVAAVPQGAALGAAYQARVTAGLEPDTSGAGRWARTDRRVEPRPEWADAAAIRYARFREEVV